MAVYIREVTKEDWRAVAALKAVDTLAGVAPENIDFLADSRFNPERVPLAAYDDQTLIGLVVCSFDMDRGSATLHRVMIDKSQKNKGYARAIMKLILRRLSEIEGCTRLTAEYAPKNVIMERFFASYGFEKNGVSAPDRTIASLELRKGHRQAQGGSDSSGAIAFEDQNPEG